MIKKIPISGMSREEWVEARKKSIGGSDASTVVGLNPYASPYSLWAEKSGALPPADISDKEAVRLGTYLEPYVAMRFSEETGKRVRRENYILYNEEYPWAHANVDRLIIGEKSGLECKTTSELNMRKFRGGEYPANYYCQCMHYMAVTGYPKWYLAVLIGNREFKIFEIMRDDEEIAALMDAEQRFWECVKAGTPPSVDGSCATQEALEEIYHDNNESIDLTPICSNLHQYLNLKAQLKAMEEKVNAAANLIKEYMGNASKGTYGDIFVSWKACNYNRFDKAEFQRNNPGIDLTPYTKTTVSRRFEVKG